MYNNQITTQEQAVCHLFFHCCYKDGAFSQAEIKTVSDKLVTAGLHKDLNVKEEVMAYQSYRNEIVDETEYLSFLVQRIQPTNGLALFSYCVELCLSDAEMSPAEETLLGNLSAALDMEAAEKDAVQKLMVQRKVVETQKLF